MACYYCEDDTDPITLITILLMTVLCVIIGIVEDIERTLLVDIIIERKLQPIILRWLILLLLLLFIGIIIIDDPLTRYWLLLKEVMTPNWKKHCIDLIVY